MGWEYRAILSDKRNSDGQLEWWYRRSRKDSANVARTLGMGSLVAYPCDEMQQITDVISKRSW